MRSYDYIKLHETTFQQATILAKRMNIQYQIAF